VAAEGAVAGSPGACAGAGTANDQLTAAFAAAPIVGDVVALRAFIGGGVGAATAAGHAAVAPSAAMLHSRALSLRTVMAPAAFFRGIAALAHAGRMASAAANVIAVAQAAAVGVNHDLGGDDDA